MMYHIKVDVKCHWSESPPVYRLYVNDDLITERTFAWPGYNIFIRENIICELEKGLHSLYIENCSDTGVFSLENFTMSEYSDSLRSSTANDRTCRITFELP